MKIEGVEMKVGDTFEYGGDEYSPWGLYRIDKFRDGLVDCTLIRDAAYATSGDPAFLMPDWDIEDIDYTKIRHAYRLPRPNPAAVLMEGECL